jgi:hypothetical protein
VVIGDKQIENKFLSCSARANAWLGVYIRGLDLVTSHLFSETSDRPPWRQDHCWCHCGTQTRGRCFLGALVQRSCVRCPVTRYKSQTERLDKQELYDSLHAPPFLTAYPHAHDKGPALQLTWGPVLSHRFPPSSPIVWYFRIIFCVNSSYRFACCTHHPSLSPEDNIPTEDYFICSSFRTS